MLTISLLLEPLITESVHAWFTSMLFNTMLVAAFTCNGEVNALNIIRRIVSPTASACPVVSNQILAYASGDRPQGQSKEWLLNLTRHS
jgi:hypothetical protein